MIYGTCSDPKCTNHGRLVKVEQPKAGTVRSSQLAASPGLRLDAAYHLARQAPCPVCGRPIAEFDEIRVTGRARGLGDEEITVSAMEALRAGTFEIAGILDNA